MKIDFAAVKTANPIDIVAETITKRRIENHKLPCPFHEDKTPSLHIYNDGGWRCYSCGRYGDVIDFAGLYFFGLNYDPHTQLLEVIDRLGSLGIRPLATDERPATQPRKPKPAGVTLSRNDCQLWHASLRSEHRQYWQDRGLADETIDRFMLGWDGGRLTIPNQYRDVVYGVKRRVYPAQPDGNKSKYTQVKGSRVGLFNADILTMLHGGDLPLFIVEGEIETMLLDQLGFPAISTTGGAGVWSAEWSKFLAHIGRIVVLYDNDDAGDDGAMKIASFLRRVEIWHWPQEYKDGGEFLPTKSAWNWLDERLI